MQRNEATKSKGYCVSYEDMVDSHTSLYSMKNTFANGALRTYGNVQIVGSINIAPLWICVEWDTKAVWVGYHWQPPLDACRIRAGMEEWFKGIVLVNRVLGTRDYRQHVLQQSRNFVDQEHQTILRRLQECQSLLDVHGAGEAAKANVRSLMRPDQNPLLHQDELLD
ncbi:hypothetical protein [Rhodoferax sp. GW822-FHT02A01]|uniref:hypothetical protein n=1 Tax=Rhodoferax sp. GW822-FHT02A01 TaxID=3141537 RepID=UPI00315CECDF